MSSCRIGDVITSAAIMGSDIRYSIYQWEPSSKVKASASTSYIRSDICNNSSSVLQGASDRHDLSSCGPHALQVTMFANIVDVLQSVWLIHDPFSICFCIWKSFTYHRVDDHRLVMQEI